MCLGECEVRGRVERVRVQHGDELAGESLLVLLGHLREHVPHQVHGAALLVRLGEHLARGRDETSVLVANDELHAGETDERDDR